jgi:hypothetical protein
MSGGTQRGHRRAQQDHVAEGPGANEEDVQRWFPVTPPSSVS